MLTPNVLVIRDLKNGPDVGGSQRMQIEEFWIGRLACYTFAAAATVMGGLLISFAWAGPHWVGFLACLVLGAVFVFGSLGAARKRVQLTSEGMLTGPLLKGRSVDLRRCRVILDGRLENPYRIIVLPETGRAVALDVWRLGRRQRRQAAQMVAPFVEAPAPS